MAAKIARLVILLALGCSSTAALASDAAANRRASANYDAVIQTSRGFRAEREHAECDTIESLDLRAQCVASFDGPLAVPPPPANERLTGDLMHPVITVTNGPVRHPDDD